METMEQEAETRPAVELKKLSPKHMQVAALLAQGVDRRTIAEHAGYVPEYVTWLQGQPLFIEYVKVMNKAVGTQLEALFAKSVATINNAMDNGNIDEQLKGAKLQLEATGRIGRFATIAPDVGGEDRLMQLSERLLGLLERQRSTVDGKVTGAVQDAEVIGETLREAEQEGGGVQAG